MSRAKSTEISSPISLYPFIGVLLCTMGALLVVLIAVSPSAREMAVRQGAALQKPRDAEKDAETKRELSDENKWQAELDQTQIAAEQQLQQGQARLSHLEGHMRILQNQLQSVQLATAELEALEKEHYDDHRQAEEEVKRRRQIITEMRDAIDTAKKQSATKQRSYALVPYEGPNGTYRRPIYVECRGNELILQPEGVRISRADLQPPFGAGNPLASALRAARAHLISLHANEGTRRDVEPYALMLVRPSGASIFEVAKLAVQNADFDFGYELVEENWGLKYPPPDPQLAVVTQQSLDQARIRQKVLAAAAPAAYRHPALALSGRFEYDESDTGPVIHSRNAGQRPGGARGERNVGVFSRPLVGSDVSQGSRRGISPDAANGVGESGFGGNTTSRSEENRVAGNGAEEGSSRQPNSDSQGAAPASGQDIAGSAGPMPDGATQPPEGSGVVGGDPSLLTEATRPTTPPAPSPDGTTPAGSAGNGGLPGLPNGDPSQSQPELAKTRGAGWALRRKTGPKVSVQRAIHVVVDKDQLTIVSDSRPHRRRASVLKMVPLPGDTVESIDAFVQAVDDQIDYWGIAGDGMTWRPVLSLHVEPGGERRAEDLARLLKDSGLEFTPPATATLNPTGDSRAAPR